MLNRRKLISLILSELSSERTYFDFKLKIALDTEPERARLLQDIATLANFNRRIPSFIIVGIEDQTRKIVGTAPLDDVRLQQLVRDYLSPSPQILYELVPYPHSGSKEVLGLLTIHPTGGPVQISKAIWKLKPGTRYTRDGSERRPLRNDEDVGDNHYESECIDLLKRASVRLEDTLKEFQAFYQATHPNYHPTHAVYRDQHVICYSGWRYKKADFDCLSEVWVQLLTEGVALFWTAVQDVVITTGPEHFTICEHALVFWNGKPMMVPLQETILSFDDIGNYNIQKRLVFKTPPASPEEIEALIDRYQKKLSGMEVPNAPESGDGAWEIFPSELLIAALNGSKEARGLLNNYMNGRADGAVAEACSEARSILKLVDGDSDAPRFVAATRPWWLQS